MIRRKNKTPTKTKRPMCPSVLISQKRPGTHREINVLFEKVIFWTLGHLGQLGYGEKAE